MWSSSFLVVDNGRLSSGMYTSFDLGVIQTTSGKILRVIDHVLNVRKAIGSNVYMCPGGIIILSYIRSGPLK
jgi:hypothetical protein